MIDIQGLLGKVANSGSTLAGILAHGEWNTLVQAVRELQLIVASDSRLANMQESINQLANGITTFENSVNGTIEDFQRDLNALSDVVDEKASIIELSEYSHNGDCFERNEGKTIYTWDNEKATVVVAELPDGLSPGETETHIELVCYTPSIIGYGKSGMFLTWIQSVVNGKNVWLFNGSYNAASLSTDHPLLTLFGLNSASANQDGLMSKEDKEFLDSLSNSPADQNHYLTLVNFDGFLNIVVFFEQTSLLVTPEIRPHCQILFYKNIHRFVLRYGTHYYTSWSTMSEHNKTDPSTGTIDPYTDKQYFYNNQIYMYDFNSGSLNPVSMGVLGPMTAAEYAALGDNVNDNILYAIAEED